ncbi:T-cell surface glycoprotein CD3 zeta chain [Sinocyclocheilus anshuiensis]|uniref:T-cell surface glycoprotein CD3 zeta chain n=1 Tax=Sinocyclocheilus anshuiensis TaxID=1608454 RepID=UPI0007B95102|nr:PREDICTED: T-cell surface glycoprotein CD3 zeta chain-like [Sinocyclocheilus anshuiensis]
MMAPRAASAVIILLSITPVSAMSTYDPQYCYILDAFLLLYCIIITAFFVRERVRVYNTCDNAFLPQNCDDDNDYGYACLFQPLQKKTDDTYREIEMKAGRRRPDQVYQGLSSVTKDTYDSLNKQPIHPPPR